MKTISPTDIILVASSLVLLMGIIPLFSNFLTKLNIDTDIRRKIAHNMIAIPVIPMYIFGVSSAVACLPYVIFGILGTVILLFTKRMRAWAEDSIKRDEPGDIYIQGLFMSIGISASILINWNAGNGPERIFVLLSVGTWAIGDSFANIAGRKFGKTRFLNYPFYGKKSLEGSIAFFISAFLLQIITIAIFGYFDYTIILKIAFIAFIATFIELVSINGIDSVTVPIYCSIFLNLLKS